MLAYSPKDPADAGVTTALERARSLHDKVRAAANKAKTYLGTTRTTAEEQRLTALCLVRDKLATLEDKLREYRLLNAYDSQAKTAMLCQLDSSRRELILVCRDATSLHSSEQAPLLKEVLAFCEMSHSEDGAMNSFADVVHRRPKVDTFESLPYRPQTVPDWDQPRALAGTNTADAANTAASTAGPEPAASAAPAQDASEPLAAYGGKLSLKPFTSQPAAKAEATSTSSEDNGPRAAELLRDQYFPRLRHQGSTPKHQDAKQRQQGEQPQPQPQPQQLLLDPGSHPHSPSTPPALDAAAAPQHPSLQPSQSAPASDRQSEGGGSAGGKKGGPGILRMVGRVAKATLTVSALAAVGVAVAAVVVSLDEVPARGGGKGKAGSRPAHLPLDAMAADELLVKPQGSAARPGVLLVPKLPAPDIRLAMG